MVEDLCNIRRGMFDLLEAVDDPISGGRFQRELASLIMRAEESKSIAANRVERARYGFHSQMCRSYGDAFVWNLLHRHTIRQLAGVEGRSPHLSGMHLVVERYLDLVERIAENGNFAFAPDLTNIIKVADVVAVNDPEVPVLLELKGELVYMTLPYDTPISEHATILGDRGVGGRLRRQLGKMDEIAEYLATGSVKPDSSSLEKQVIEVDTELGHYWPEVEEAVQGALDNQDHLVLISDLQRIWDTRG